MRPSLVFLVLSACPGPLQSPDAGTDAGCQGNCGGGTPCRAQQDCLDAGYGVDNPLGQCINGYCDRSAQGIEIRLAVNTAAYNGFPGTFQTLNTRLVAGSALDGTPVSCTTLQALAADAGTAPNAIEASRRFNLVGYDVSPVQAMPGQTFFQPYLPTDTASGYLLWTELWSGRRDSTTLLPTGVRYGWGCFSGLRALTTADGVQPDGGPGPPVYVTMPPPNG